MKKNEREFLVGLAVLIMLFGIGSGSLGSIFGDEFDSSVSLSGSFSLPKAGIVNQSFTVESDSDRSFYSGEDRTFYFEGTQQVNTTTNPARFLCGYKESDLSLCVSNVDDVKIGFITPEDVQSLSRDSPEVKFDQSASGGSGLYFVDSQRFCGNQFEGRNAQLGCVQSETHRPFDPLNVDRVWGVFTYVNGEKVAWNQDLSDWSHTTPPIFGSSSFSTNILIPKQALKDYYNRVDVRFESRGIQQSFGAFEIYAEPEECRSRIDLQATYVPGGSVVKLNPSANELSLPSSNGMVKSENVKFCHTSPVRMLTPNGIKDEFYPYDSLVENGSITVPENEGWLFFYIGETSEDNVEYCVDGTVFDSEDNPCTKIPSFEYFCSQGSFNEDRLSCFTNNQDLCEGIGGVYLPSDNICVKVDPVECSGKLVEENGVLKCFTEPEVVCDGEYNSDTGVCEALPEIEGRSEGDELNLDDLGLALIGLAGGAVAWFYLRK